MWIALFQMLQLFLNLIMMVVYNQQKIILWSKTEFSGLTIFFQFNCFNGTKSYPELFTVCSCAEEDKAFNKEESNCDNDTESESEEDSSDMTLNQKETQVKKTQVTTIYLT